MKNATSKNRRFLSLLIYWGSWTLVAVFFSIQIYADSLYAVRQGGQALTWLQALSLSLVEWYVWAVLGLAIFPLSRRFTFERSYWIRRLALHFFAAAFFALLKLLIHSTLSKMLPWASIYAPRPSFMVFSLAYLTYWEIIAIAHGVDYYRKYREKALRASQLESSLAKAQVHALKMQLQPHFLFNTLHSVSTLMHENVDAADDMLTLLSDLLRQSLETGGAQEVPLRKEIEFLQTYLDIQKIRFREHLAFKIKIDSGVLDALVPNFLLQPLVENAVLHGISRLETAGEVSIRAGLQDGVLRITIKDNGPGLRSHSDKETKTGIGLQNTRMRLAQLYGEHHAFEIRDDHGVEVEIGLPFHTRPLGEAQR